MLTQTEAAYLLRQRELLISAVSKADIYHGAVEASWDVHVAWWRLFRAAAVRRQRRRTLALRDAWEAEVYRRDALITGWINVYQVTTGERRGPISATGKQPAAPTWTAIDEWSSGP